MKFIKNGQYQDRSPNTETSRADDFFWTLIAGKSTDSNSPEVDGSKINTIGEFRRKNQSSKKT
jgi:hypothetical protein